MKQTKIKYLELSNNKIRIVDVVNVGTKKELLQMLGLDYFKDYINTRKCHYYLNKEGFLYIMGTEFRGACRIFKLAPSVEITKQEFNQAIKIMKEAGTRLTELRKEREQQKAEIKEVTI